MDILLGKVTQQAMNYAIRSGVTITATYAIKQCGQLLKEAPRSKEREELMRLQLRLESKIRIISPAIDMIELISARGNTSLESAVSLTKELRYEIQKLGTRVANAAEEEKLVNRKSSRAKPRSETERELKAIVSAIKDLIERIEDAVPLINLAITTSGVNLSTKLSGTISPSRLLQASTFITAADGKYASGPDFRQQVGPTYTVSLYMLFAGHARPTDKEGVRETTWKEVIHKAHVKLMRVPLDQLYSLPGDDASGQRAEDVLPGEEGQNEFAYQLLIVEDLDDDRVHTLEDDEAPPGPFEDVTNAGIRDIVPVHEVSKVFYADTGKILNIGGDNDVQNPVLLLKRDVHAEPPRRMLHRSQMGGRYSYFDDTQSVNGDGQSELNAQIERESNPGTPLKSDPHSHTSSAWRLPADLDPEWLAFEVYSEETDSDTEDGVEPETTSSSRPSSSRHESLSGALNNLNLRSSVTSTSPSPNGQQLVPAHPSGLYASPNKTALPPIKTSLSLFEMLLKLAALQQFRQESHLAIDDETLNFFLEDSATAGAGGDKTRRQRTRMDAMRRVGFDPYDESPIKRRGEEYIQHARGAASPRAGLPFDPEAYPQQLPYDEAYDYDSNVHSPYNIQDYEQPIIDQPGYSREPTPSSPSPRPLMLQQTPSRSSTPGSVSSERHRQDVRAKYTGGGHGMVGNGIQTPPSTSASARSRQAVLRAQSDGPKPRSPLARELMSSGGGGARGGLHGQGLGESKPAAGE